MNKDLPIIIKKIFETPDRTIWRVIGSGFSICSEQESILNVFLDNIQTIIAQDSVHLPSINTLSGKLRGLLHKS